MEYQLDKPKLLSGNNIYFININFNKDIYEI